MTEVRLHELPIGATFILHLDTTGREIRGVVVRHNMGSVTVEVDGLPEKGELRAYPSGVSHWDMSTLVRLVALSKITLDRETEM